MALVSCSSYSDVSIDTAPDAGIAELDVRVTIGATGTKVIAVNKSQGVSISRITDGGFLRYELRDASMSLVREGLVYDPRRARSEIIEGTQYVSKRLSTDNGVLSLRLPSVSGTLVIFEQNHGWQELARLDFDPAQTNLTANALLNRPADIIGQPAKIVDHGPVSNHVDILFLPDGYTEAQMDAFHADVQKAVEGLQTMADYAPYWQYFNVWRQDVKSRESGIDNPTTNLTVDTAFDVSFNQGGVFRCTYPQSAAAQAAIVELGQQVGADFVIVIANVPDWAGCAGPQFIVQSRADGLDQILAHELGHGLLGLDDEYSDGECPAGTSGKNVADSLELDRIPWADMINAAHMPTTLGPDGLDAIGAWEGAGYCTTGKYRPQFNCMMRTSGTPFCKVCRRLMDRYFANIASLGGANSTAPDTGSGTGTGTGAGTGTSGDTGSGSDNATCPETLRGDGLCDPCLGDDSDCNWKCKAKWYNDGFCDVCIRNDPDCNDSCPASWNGDGVCDSCVRFDVDCSNAQGGG